MTVTDTTLQRGRVQMHAEGGIERRAEAIDVALQRGRVQMHAEGGRDHATDPQGDVASTGPRADARGRPKIRGRRSRPTRSFNGAACRCTRKGARAVARLRAGGRASTGPRADARGRSPSAAVAPSLESLQRGRVQMHAEGALPSADNDVQRRRASTGPRADARGRSSRFCAPRTISRLQRGRVQMHAEGPRPRSRPATCCCFNGAACRCTRKVRPPPVVAIMSAASTGPRADARGRRMVFRDRAWRYVSLQRGRVQMHAEGRQITVALSLLQRGRVQMHAEGPIPWDVDGADRALQRGRVQMHAEGPAMGRATTTPRLLQRGRVQMHAEGATSCC